MNFTRLYQELTTNADIIQAFVVGVTPEQARWKPEPAAWSILEVINHLYDEEREDFRQRLDIILHRPAETWPPIDPEGWVTARRYNERSLAHSSEAFAAERQQSLAWLSGLAEADWQAEYQAPFGRITAGDMLAAWVAHDSLHLRQLVELRRAYILQAAAPYRTVYAGDW